MASDDYEEKYTKPDLRRELKEDIKQSDKGGEPGQWSARKSQLLVQEYEKRGGGYKKDEKDDAAQSLEAWTNQDWQTKEGDADAQQGSAMKRYLPQKAWAMLTDEQTKEAEKTKKEVSREGEQHADWPDAVKKAMWALGFAEGEDVPEPTKDELQTWAAQLDISGRSTMTKDELVQAIRDAEIEGSEDGNLSDLTKDELYERAQDLDVSGRSKMDKDELEDAVREA